LKIHPPAGAAARDGVEPRMTPAERPHALGFRPVE
jgi:hypothetical protein